MGPVIDLAQPLAVHVAVRLRRRERAVAEQLLDHPQVGAALEQVRRECVPQPVRVREQPPERARVEPPAARGDEQRVLGAVDELRAAVVQVEPQPVCGLLAERDDALLAALAPDVDRLLLEVDVAEIEVDRLAAAQPGRVDELEQRAVAERRAGRRPRTDRAPRRPRRTSGASGRRRARLGPSCASGTRPAPSANRSRARTAASLRAIVAGASLLGSRPGRAAPSSAVYALSVAASTSSSDCPRFRSQDANSSTSTR